MQVFVNKKAVDLSEGASLHDLIEQLGLCDKPIAVAIGAQIIARSVWQLTPLISGASISIITICKGG